MAEIDPLEFARAEVVRVVGAAGTQLHALPSPDPAAFRFRCDGRGGEWATPYPLIVRVSPQQLAHACPSSPYLESVHPSGSWLALDLSERWRDMVRTYTPSLTPAADCAPPIPDFPARILPESWRIQSLLPHPSAACAARLDGGNPYVKLLRAQRLAAHAHPGSPSRLVINQCALLAHLLVSGEEPSSVGQQALHLAETYLAHRCEPAAVAHYLEMARFFLGI